MSEPAQVPLSLVYKAVDAAANAVFITDSHGAILYVNRGFEALTGYRRHEVLGENPRILNSGLHNPEFFRSFWDILMAGDTFRGDIINRRKDGSRYEATQTVTPVLEEREVIAYIAIQDDVTEHRRSEARIEFQAYHDALTGLPNRTLLMDRLSQALRSARRDTGLVCLFLLDLDRFKEVNDRFGHEAGDRLLVEASTRVLGLIREADTLARLGGDEFALLLSGDVKRVGDPAALAGRVCTALAQPFLLDAGEASISVSIGIAIGPQDGEQAEELLKSADQAMYGAKEAGRNTYQFFV